MKKVATVLLVAAAALACRGRSAPAQRTQQQYDVVEEGQTTSATSTIAAPGEVRPPIATATNTDTTATDTTQTTDTTSTEKPKKHKDKKEQDETPPPPPPTQTDTIGNH